MLKELLNQFFIFISFIFIGAHIIRDTNILSKKAFIRNIVIGMYGALMAITLMSFTIPVPASNTVVDLRYMALLLIYFYFGFIPSILTAVAMILYRLSISGINESSVTAVLSICLYFVSYWLLDHFVKHYLKKWVSFFLASIIISMSSLVYLLKGTDYLNLVLIEYLLVSVGGVIILYVLSEYAKTSNELYSQYKTISTKDFLTGLNNTRQFDHIYNELISRAKEQNQTIGMMMIDIDHFKQVNDTYGHPAGDSILKQVSMILRGFACKSYSISRIGGEEFCILMDHVNKRQAYDIAENVRSSVEKHHFCFESETCIKVTVSIGVAISPDTIMNPEKIKHHADQLLYQAKQTGRNKVCI
ncbi:GGDEF domain-containing protein [Haloplasma contractile]|uniref:GGDEF domain protein n=1 Tax=Haloplasma contractile SSD-17B TaxID=1033810 RepID=F7Q1G8_9MOLU|nr:diguanylate cyclase [Haloplasma contractile]ERJ12890.1 GGDEF domain protein [Haloplasma contractile SSD-17B]